MATKTAYKQAWEFFYANAGFGYDPKTETKRQGKARAARQMAKAEREAASLGYSFEWVEDYTDVAGSLGDHEYSCDNAKNGYADTCQHEIYTCLIWAPDGKDIVGSLGAIIDPDRNYRRVVQAELALEALHV